MSQVTVMVQCTMVGASCQKDCQHRVPHEPDMSCVKQCAYCRVVKATWSYPGQTQQVDALRDDMRREWKRLESRIHNLYEFVGTGLSDETKDFAAALESVKLRLAALEGNRFQCRGCHHWTEFDIGNGSCNARTAAGLSPGRGTTSPDSGCPLWKAR